MNTPQITFKEAYTEAVKEALLILGENVSAIINTYITEKYSIHLQDTVNNPKALSDTLEAVIDGGSKIVQRKILRLLYNKIGIDTPFAITTGFEERVFYARKEYEKLNLINSGI